MAELREENARLAKQVAGLEVEQEVKDLRYLSASLDGMADMETRSAKAEQKQLVLESWAEERVISAQDEAAAKVAEAFANAKDLLQKEREKHTATLQQSTENT